MYSQVTIIPSDGLIAVNSTPFILEFSALANVHAIQWLSGVGHIEFTDSTANQMLEGREDYERYVLPYADMWDTENTRRVAEANRIPSLEDAVESKINEIFNAYQAAFAPVKSSYPATEREGWTIQENEAIALYADPNANAPVLSALVAYRGRGETVMELATRVLQNAAAWRTIYASLTGQQQRMYREVSLLTTAQEVIAYKVNFIFPEGVMYV